MKLCKTLSLNMANGGWGGGTMVWACTALGTICYLALDFALEVLSTRPFTIHPPFVQNYHVCVGEGSTLREKVKKRNFYNLTCVLIALCGVILRVSEVSQTHFGACVWVYGAHVSATGTRTHTH